jgi:hypothetical protein
MRTDSPKDYIKQYIFIIQSLQDASECKIGLTDYLEATIKNITDETKENVHRFIFICEVREMIDIWNDIREKFFTYRVPKADKKDEVYFLNDELFEIYVEYIKSHPLFVDEMAIMKNINIEKIERKTTPPSENEDFQQMTLC